MLNKRHKLEDLIKGLVLILGKGHKFLSFYGQNTKVCENRMYSNNLMLANNALKDWGATPAEVINILYVSSAEQEKRVHCILSIRNHLEKYFTNSINQTGFMTMKNHNPYFNGRTPLEMICTGSLEALINVELRVRHMGEW